MNSRIMVHVFWDLILPFQRGKPGSPERKKSNEELERVFKQSKYYPKLDMGDLFYEDGYFVTDKWELIMKRYGFRAATGEGIPRRRSGSFSRASIH